MKLSDLTVLSTEETVKIHNGSLRTLEEVGMVIESDSIIDLLADNGCRVNRSERRVYYPAALVERCLAGMPARIKLCNRLGEPAFTLGDGGRYCASGHNAVFVLSGDDGERRPSTLRDVEEFAIVSDRLSAVDMIGVPVMPQDVTAQTTLLHAVKAIMENSVKPIFFSSESESINRAIIAMGRAVAGRPAEGHYLISQLSTTSPLFWERGAVEALRVVAEAGIPCDFLPQPIAGVTAPYTLAGLLTMHNTEVLSGIVIAQLINPGTPLIYGAAWTTYEMKSSNVLIGRPESSLLRIAGAQMARYYGMPSHTTAPDNDANLHDEQGAWEKMLSTVAGIVGANDMIVNLGMFGTGMSISLEQLVMDEEMCRIVGRFLRGIEVSEQTIALDAIAAVGPRGTFLMEDHTLAHLRSGEHIDLHASNGTGYEVWKAGGSHSSVDNARAVVAAILRDGCQTPLEAEKAGALAGIIEEYEREL